MSSVKEQVKLGFSTYTPPEKDECFKYEDIEVSIKAPSSKVVFANDLRAFFKDQVINFKDEDHNINTPYGWVKATRYFAKNNVICVSTGNTSMLAFQKKDLLILTNGYHPDIEEYGYSEEIKDESRNINKTLDSNGFKLKAEISCSLWWMMGADIEMIDMDKLKAAKVDFYELSVKPETTLSLKFNTQSKFKFYEIKTTMEQ